MRQATWTILMVLAVAGTAGAGVTLEYTYDCAPCDGMCVINVTLVADDAASVIMSFDGGFYIDDECPCQCENECYLNQVWLFDAMPTPHKDSFSPGLWDPTCDTHFNIPEACVSSRPHGDPSEDGPGCAGTYLKGSFGLWGICYTWQLDLAQLVLCPCGCECCGQTDLCQVHALFDVATTDGGLHSFDQCLVCPEPATMAVLGGGALALAARRRRR